MDEVAHADEPVELERVGPLEVGPADDHSAVKPPSTGSATPVTNDAASEARKTATEATSSGRHNRPSGCDTSCSRRAAAGSGIESMKPRSIGVSTEPGQIALTRIPSGAQSSASARASWTAAPFVAT